MIKAWVTLVYGILILMGGIMGFVMANSVPSLLAGGSLGIGLIVAAVLMFKSKPVGWPIALVCTLLVSGNFVMLLIRALDAEYPSVARPVGILTLSAIELAVLFLAKKKTHQK